jgi:hypothetical protein
MYQFMRKGSLAVSPVVSLNVVLMPRFRPNEFKKLVVDFVTRT